jgi:spore coat protein U-like protein
MKKKFAALLAAAAIMSVGTVYAATQSNNMYVYMDVYTPTSCTISAGGTMDFGTYITNYSNSYGATTNVNVACTSNRSYNLYPDSGLNFQSDRRMTRGGVDYLNYALFQDNGYYTQWNSSNRVYSTGIGSTQTYTVYGYLWGNQLATSGASDGVYQDTVTMTVEYTP